MASSRRLDLVWLLLAAITLVSWWIGSKHSHDAFRPNLAVTAGVLAIAGLKIRIIMRHFMETRSAPVALGRLTDAWIILTLGTLFTVYVSAS